MLSMSLIAFHEFLETHLSVQPFLSAAIAESEQWELNNVPKVISKVTQRIWIEEAGAIAHFPRPWCLLSL